MVLVDTSVWVEHLHRRLDALSRLLMEDRVVCHPFVIGELACGALNPRHHMLQFLCALESAPVAGTEEVLTFIETHRLYGRGVGWIDAHLLASATLASLPFWTLDRRLAAAARQVGVGGDGAAG